MAGASSTEPNNCAHPEAADPKHARFAPGFYDPFNDSKNALREAIDSVSDNLQAAIQDAWIRPGHDGMVDFTCFVCVQTAGPSSKHEKADLLQSFIRVNV
jgi:hypothetical protein